MPGAACAPRFCRLSKQCFVSRTAWPIVWPACQASAARLGQHCSRQPPRSTGRQVVGGLDPGVNPVGEGSSSKECVNPVLPRIHPPGQGEETEKQLKTRAIEDLQCVLPRIPQVPARQRPSGFLHELSPHTNKQTTLSVH